jgi:hypothetical protein
MQTPHVTDWYFYDTHGTKHGPVDDRTLQLLAKQRDIDKKTIIEKGDKRAYAEKVKGLEFPPPFHKQFLPSEPPQEIDVDESNTFWLLEDNTNNQSNNLNSDWYYYSDDGNRNGPISVGMLMALALQQAIHKDTIIESNTRVKYKASQMAVLGFSFHTKDETSPRNDYFLLTLIGLLSTVFIFAGLFCFSDSITSSTKKGGEIVELKSQLENSVPRSDVEKTAWNMAKVTEAEYRRIQTEHSRIQANFDALSRKYQEINKAVCCRKPLYFKGLRQNSHKISPLNRGLTPARSLCSS